MDGHHGILNRVGFLIAANVHAIVTAAAEAQSTAVFDEYIREARGALDGLISAEGVQRGRAKTLARRIDALQASISQADRDVDLLLSRGERGLAAVQQSLINTRSDTLAGMQAQRQQCLEQVARLSKTRANLSARIDTLESERLRLEGMLEQRKAAQLQQKMLIAAGGAMDGQGRTALIVERVAHKLDVEEGKVEAATSSLESGIAAIIQGEVVDRQLDARLAQLREAGALPALSSPGSDQETVASQRKRLSSGAKPKASRQKPTLAHLPSDEQE
jgi:phage shock protein A